MLTLALFSVIFCTNTGADPENFSRGGPTLSMAFAFVIYIVIGDLCCPKGTDVTVSRPDLKKN